MNSLSPDIAQTLNDSPALAALLTRLRGRHGESVTGMILYGSCLRSGDIYEGLLDIYVICSNYRSAHRNPLVAASNWMLTPNVYYDELEVEGRMLRTKYAAISLADFQRGCSRWFQSYIWGRFSQPVYIAWANGDGARSTLEQSLSDASRTCLRKALPALPPSGTVIDLWEQSLGLSYGTELRAESSGRPGELARASADFFAAQARSTQGSLPFAFTVYDAPEGLCYRADIPTPRRQLSRLGWSLRRGLGKLLAILRLVKALFTFTGGLDYVAWKLERHSGQKVEIPTRVRRYPLLFMWGYFWRLYRQGVFK
jgi:hypothetical protein